jgi:hypothetical protein
MRRGADARRRPIIAHSEHAAIRLRLGPGTPPGDACGCKRGVQKLIDTASFSTPRIADGVIAHPSARQFASNRQRL